MLFFYLASAALALCGAAKAQLQLSDALTMLPACALDCVLKGLSASPCSFTDISCICTTVPLQAKLSICIQGACIFPDQQRVADVNKGLCETYPIESNGQIIIIICLVFGAITAAVIMLRCLSRWKIVGRLWWDDWFILMAGVVMTTLCVASAVNCYMGFGSHYWKIHTSDIQTLLKIFWVNEVLYNTVLALVRISILFFYLRLFQQRWFKNVVRCAIGFILLAALTFNLVILFQCTPVYSVWDLAVPGRQCVSVNSLAYAAAGIGIVEDFFILFLPLPLLWNLQMSWGRKINILAMFGVGSLACITSIVRLRFIVAFGDSQDPTWDYVIPTIWSIIEISVAEICACLPAIRALLARWFPTLFERTSSDPTNKNVSSRSKSRTTTFSSNRLPSFHSEAAILDDNANANSNYSQPTSNNIRLEKRKWDPNRSILNVGTTNTPVSSSEESLSFITVAFDQRRCASNQGSGDRIEFVNARCTKSAGR